jgi:hypothetical protein
MHQQSQPDLLPDLHCDLHSFRDQIVVGSDQLPNEGREKMPDQLEILKFRFRNLPETCLLVGLCISYLRRDTLHTTKAAKMFQRLWAEEYPILLSLLPTRWLISSFQTFLEFGCNEMQRQIGGSSFFFANLLKAYEAERSLEGLPPNSIYRNSQPVTEQGFHGLDRFNLGGTDLMVNTLAMLLELSTKDAVAGRPVHEFFLRLKDSNSVFSRMDASRIAHEIEVPQFANCWSFFEKPDVH